MDTILLLLDISTLTLGRSLALLGSAIGLSALITATYFFTHRNMAISARILLTILMMGPIAGVIVLVVGNSLARAVSIGGGIALIRYRYTMSDPRDLIFLFLSLAVGMTCGVGAIGYAAVACVVLCLVLILANLTHFDHIRTKALRLKVTVAEDTNYVGMFDEVLKKYCTRFLLTRVKTTDYGTLVDLHFSICMKDQKEQKEMIDEIRTLNGNLTVQLTETADEAKNG